MDVKLTAAMGKRTKYQVHEHAQLLLVAKSSLVPRPVPEVVIPPRPPLKYDEQGQQQEDEESKSEEDLSGWDSGKYEVGKRVVLEEAVTGEEVAVRRILLDDTDGGARENILLEEGVKFTHLEKNKDAGNEQGSLTSESLDELTSTILHPIDQSIILALCLDVSNSNAAVRSLLGYFTNTL